MIAISINKPAADTLLDEAHAIKFDVRGEQPRIRPWSPDEDDHVVEISRNERGSMSGSVEEGPLVGDLIKLLGGDPTRSFYTIKMGEKGWLNLVRWSQPVAPAKHIPWIRIRDLRRSKPEPVSSSAIDTIDGIIEAIERARKLVLGQKHTIGRPTKELMSAERLLAAVRHVGEEMYGPHVHPRDLAIMRDILNKLPPTD